jgi:hypothetical protein
MIIKKTDGKSVHNDLTGRDLTDAHSQYLLAANVPVKATAAEITAGTNDTKFATALALRDSQIVIAYTPTFTPQAGTYTDIRNLDTYYQIVGGMLHFYFSFDGTLSAVSTSIAFTLPVTIKTVQIDFPVMCNISGFGRLRLSATSAVVTYNFVAATRQGASGMFICRT